jgi:hypothetical protein
MRLDEYLALPLFPAKQTVRDLTCIHVHKNLTRSPASIEAGGKQYRLAKGLWAVAAEACLALDKREREPPCSGPLGKLLRCLAAGGDTVSVATDPDSDEEPVCKLADRLAASALARLQSEIARSVTRLYEERKDSLVEEALASLE